MLIMTDEELLKSAREVLDIAIEMGQDFESISSAFSDYRIFVNGKTGRNIQHSVDGKKECLIACCESHSPKVGFSLYGADVFASALSQITRRMNYVLCVEKDEVQKRIDRVAKASKS